MQRNYNCLLLLLLLLLPWENCMFILLDRHACYWQVSKMQLLLLPTRLLHIPITSNYFCVSSWRLLRCISQAIPFCILPSIVLGQSRKQFKISVIIWAKLCFSTSTHTSASHFFKTARSFYVAFRSVAVFKRERLFFFFSHILFVCLL